MHFSSAMSRLAGLLAILLSTSALADSVDPPATPPKSEDPAKAEKTAKFFLKVVKIMGDSEQALLYDKNKGKHVLVDVGDTVGHDYIVSAIDEDEVTLTGKDMPIEISLPAPESKKARAAAAKKAPEAGSRAKEPAPSDPYDTASTDMPTESEPSDPYGAEPIREVSAKKKADPIWVTADEPADAPKTEGAKGVDNLRSTSVKKQPEPKKPAKKAEKTDDVDLDSFVTATTGEAPKAETKAEVKVEPPKPAVATISRKEFNAALADFGALSTSIDASFTAQGLAVAKVAPGSVFAKAGLQAGDTITAVDGKPLRTLDDAANLYARAGSIKNASVTVSRDGKSQTLRVAIQ